ncbi:MAG TPA: 3-deoxy-7-phosphoheptulonate synthase class II [Allosphingosinicella sp.]|uniref:3-deoxy-7-phosphoheptulonate synthase class II n=1 Tax=Allosphingosinicella sp. TaxID=2823234 RepID=UPI002ED814D4
MVEDWSPASWREHEARQQPVYADAAALQSAEAELASYPALVEPLETDALKAAIADAQQGRAFLLQGGDCAESFAEFSPANIDASFRLIMNMGGKLAAASGLPIVKTARMAGQFAKPRSRDEEVKDGVALPIYRGDIVNGIGFDAAARAPDPSRMFRAYAQAYATLSRFAELGEAAGERLYTCHEALLLPYEQALTRKAGDQSYDTSAHFLWIGDRTRFLGSAHVEFARGFANPLGLKCGPSLTPDLLLRLLDVLDPERQPGRITLISRMGAEDVRKKLPPLVRAVQASGHLVLWSCDPMHGNTVKAANGYKTRPFSRILDEVRYFFEVTPAEGAIPGGIHVEMTGQNVTECTGGTVPVTEQDLGDRYHTHCDPRLNPAQAMELAELVAELLPRSQSKAA